VNCAENEPGEGTGRIDGCEENRIAFAEHRPGGEDECNLKRELARDSECRCDAGVMREVAVAPYGLRDADNHAETRSAAEIHRTAEERPMDERVRDRIGRPPDVQRNDHRKQPHGDGSYGWNCRIARMGEQSVLPFTFVIPPSIDYTSGFAGFPLAVRSCGPPRHLAPTAPIWPVPATCSRSFHSLRAASR